LNEKIRQIREAYGWTQPEFIRRLGLEGELTQSDIQAFEREPGDRWSREPALPHLLIIARLAGVTIDVLVDPAQELPDKLPPDPTHGMVRRSREATRQVTAKVKVAAAGGKRPMKKAR
jgi:transcriptional regulator with XRE-family HTH domain